jgi:hypothetical protein
MPVFKQAPNRGTGGIAPRIRVINMTPGLLYSRGKSPPTTVRHEPGETLEPVSTNILKQRPECIVIWKDDFLAHDLTFMCAWKQHDVIQRGKLWFPDRFQRRDVRLCKQSHFRIPKIKHPQHRGTYRRHKELVSLQIISRNILLSFKFVKYEFCLILIRQLKLKQSRWW